MIVENAMVKLVPAGPGVVRKILARGGGLMSVEVHFQKGAVGVVHAHPHEQVSYILKGSFEFEMAGQKQVLIAGDSYYVAPGIPHGVVALEEAEIFDIFTPQREDFLS